MSEVFSTLSGWTLWGYIIYSLIRDYMKYKNEKEIREKRSDDEKILDSLLLEIRLILKETKSGNENFIEYQRKSNMHVKTMIEDHVNSMSKLIDMILQNLINNKGISDEMWNGWVRDKIESNVQKTLNGFARLFDENGIENENDLTLLKEKLASIASKYRQIARDEISIMNWDNKKLEAYLEMAKDSFVEYNNNVEKVIKSISIHELAIDKRKHFKRFKGSMENEVYRFQTSLFEIIKVVIKN